MDKGEEGCPGPTRSKASSVVGPGIAGDSVLMGHQRLVERSTRYGGDFFFVLSSRFITYHIRVMYMCKTEQNNMQQVIKCECL